jgi:hypothetical protein
MKSVRKCFNYLGLRSSGQLGAKSTQLLSNKTPPGLSGGFEFYGLACSQRLAARSFPQYSSSLNRKSSWVG